MKTFERVVRRIVREVLAETSRTIAAALPCEGQTEDTQAAIEVDQCAFCDDEAVELRPIETSRGLFDAPVCATHRRLSPHLARSHFEDRFAPKRLASETDTDARGVYRNNPGTR